MFSEDSGASNRYKKDGGASLSICQLWRQIQPKYGALSMNASDGALCQEDIFFMMLLEVATVSEATFPFEDFHSK